MSDDIRPLWQNFPELLKIELSTVAFLYVALGLFVNAIAGQNALHFNLALGKLPAQFIPYAPIFEKITWFTVLNLFWTGVGFGGAFLSAPRPKLHIILAVLNALLFLASLGYFAMIAYSLKMAFYYSY